MAAQRSDADAELGDALLVGTAPAAADKASWSQIFDTIWKVATLLALATIAVELWLLPERMQASAQAALQGPSDSSQAIATHLGTLANTVKHLDEPAKSPLTSAISHGIHAGVQKTLGHAAEKLGMEAIRDGTFIPALIRSTLHIDFKAVSETALRLYDAAQQFSTIGCRRDDDRCMMGFDGKREIQEIKALIEQVDQHLATVPWPTTQDPKYPAWPNVSAWVDTNLRTPLSAEMWRTIETPCHEVVSNLRDVDWAEIPYTWACDTSYEYGDCYTGGRCTPGSYYACPTGDYGECPASGMCPATISDHVRSHSLLGILEPKSESSCFAQCTVTGAGTATCAGTMDGLDAGQVNRIEDAVKTFCSEMAK